MASGRRSVKQELFTNTTKRPTAIEITDSKSVVQVSVTQEEVEKKSESTSSSSDNESKSELQEYINKLEEKNQLLEEELANFQRLTTSLPRSLLTVIFPNTQHSNTIKEELGCIIQDFCNRKREELNIKDEVKTPGESNEQAMSCVEYNDLYSMERYPDAPISTPVTATNKFPKYSQIYKRIVEPKSNKPFQPNSNETLLVKPLLKLDSFNRPSRSCFNCGGNHTVKDCKEVKDFNKIRANKQEYMNAQGGEQHNRYQNSEQDISSSERPRDRREHYHRSASPNPREKEHYFHRNHPNNMSREEKEKYSNSRFSRESSRDREGRAYYSRYQPHSNYYIEKDNRNSYHSNRSDRDVHIRMSSTPSKGSPRNVRMVDYRSKVEYSSTYGDMELSDQELEDGEIINLSPRQSFHSQPPLPPAYPPYFVSPPLPHPDMYNPYIITPPATRDARAHIEFRKETVTHRPHYSHSMPDVRIGTKRRYTRGSPEASYSNRGSYIESSTDSSSIFKTNEHNFSLDFPPGIVTPESMRAPERFNTIRRIIDRRK